MGSIQKIRIAAFISQQSQPSLIVGKLPCIKAPRARRFKVPFKDFALVVRNATYFVFVLRDDKTSWLSESRSIKSRNWMTTRLRIDFAHPESARNLN